ncbi:Bcr/CflA family drug resistance efflux transporter [Chitinophaga cymbidii]|uniref:Bcr/CflA family drug resistance efflux transporter n=2 Tax=Chitinophaga cymbidii TaxID=1096750 RepID=A0A512RNC8_9BACT|nr:Bcr/CflA family drug resistance efflux transporter [Chitinophaga cymbidii]
MDVYIPSLPDMAVQLNTTPAAIQLTLSLFIISYGVSQLIVGGLIDTYGRYRPNLAAMLVFSASSFLIAYTKNLPLIYVMRVVQGFAVAVIIVSKRSFFVDMYRGDQLKKYTSLFSVIWAIGPIVAPFLGGFFQTTWGWTSNFIFLGCFSLLFFIVEIFTGGESQKAPQPLSVRVIADSYFHMIKKPDFSAGMGILGFTYAMILLYGMASPFLIEHRLHLSPAVTGYCALFSGVSVMTGGTISRILIRQPFVKKLVIASGLQVVLATVIIISTFYHQSLVTLMLYVFLLHSTGGFIFNNLMSYCLTRFPQYAGKATGLVGGGFSVVTSILSTLLVKVVSITDQTALGVAYAVLIIGTLLLIVKTKWKTGESVVFETADRKQLTA